MKMIVYRAKATTEEASIIGLQADCKRATDTEVHSKAKAQLQESYTILSIKASRARCKMPSSLKIFTGAKPLIKSTRA